MKEMAAVRKGSGATARRRIRDAVKEAVASLQETNGAASNGVIHCEPDIESIRLRAHEIFVGRGATHGDDLVDWFNAEREMRGARNP